MDSAVISYGPCQTPTLGFCVDRYDEIQSFKPKSFWCIDMTLEVVPFTASDCCISSFLLIANRHAFFLVFGEKIRGRILELECDRGRMFEKHVCDSIMGGLAHDKEVICKEVKLSETKKQRPQALNTVELLKLASKSLGMQLRSSDASTLTLRPASSYALSCILCAVLFHLSLLIGIGPQAAMRAAEHLYLSGYLSYPRTESTAYPSTFSFREVLQSQRTHIDWGGYANLLLKEGFNAARTGHDAGGV